MNRVASYEVKVCGMRTAENIARVAALSPDYLGFVFVPESPRYVGHAIGKEVLDLLPTTISTVGVFRNQTSTFVEGAVKGLGLRIVQLHGVESRDFMRSLKTALPSVQIWRAVSISTREDVSKLEDEAEGVDRFLLDSGMGGTGRAFDWQWLMNYRAPIPFMLAGGIGVTNIDIALDVSRQVEGLVGFDINSRVEVEPAIKDIEKVKGVLDKVRNWV